MRSLLKETSNWDEPLPQDQEYKWKKWKESLDVLETLFIPRIDFHDSWIRTAMKKIHVFCDASEVTISAVAYVENQGQYGFILETSKLAPVHGHSILRLELCGALLAVEIAQSVSVKLEISIEQFKFYCDSKVVLGYISNHSRRFYQYVSYRVMKIHKVTKSKQWFYIPSERNPANEATRPIHASELQHSKWLEGPEQS